ncbi:zinc-dependent alcohol dehydrogenase [Ammoniphilus resinae]|uniref:L-iditol 2-dehydrogenase n=1 Tax=Ammoniphilus resinae TaxID=861532 RepID=A0ABS4GX02_9BACL|nr:zinc-binding dehydrogenase [Ammoniphilus resinae]MBP1934567.1 L-iditol 2-dehydrogenase [Ammoniphilus resinae]
MKNMYQAAVVYGPGDIRLENLEHSTPAADEVKIQVFEANICPTDLRGYRGAKEIRHPERVGHEFAGYVTEVGSSVTRFKIGDRVTAMSWTACYRCEKCTRGKYSACPHRTLNMGAFGEYITVKEWVVYKLPEHLSFGVASCAEPLASVLKACTVISRVTLGDQVVVYGLGPMGILHLQVCKLLGATVIGIDLIPERLEIARKAGADAVINGNDVDVIKEVKELTGGGADVVIVAVGGAAEAPCTENALKMAAHGCRINIFTGTFPLRKMTIDPNLIHYGEYELSGTRSYNPKTFELALDLLAKGQINVDLVRTPTITLDDIKHGFDIHGTREAMKVAVTIRK